LSVPGVSIYNISARSYDNYNNTFNIHNPKGTSSQKILASVFNYTPPYTGFVGI
jgi:hypothetical protein